MQVLVYLIVGFVFGGLLSYGKLNKNNSIIGLSVLKDFTVAKVIMLVLGVGGLLLALEMMAGGAVFHVKSFFLVGVIGGGLIFGTGMALLGYCPGTLPVSLGQGSLDAFWGIVGGLAGGLLYTLVAGYIEPFLGPNLGKPTLFSLMGASFSWTYMLVVLGLGMVLAGGALWLHRLDVRRGNAGRQWVATALGLAVLNVLLFYNGWNGKPLGASTSYPYVAASLTGCTHSAYYSKVVGAGSWQVWFLLGALLAGFAYAVATKTFRLRLVHERWQEYKGTSKRKRVLWSLLGGAVLLFGARLANGCTSGHIITGGMQFALGSWLFAMATFAGFLLTGYLFYTRRRR